VHLGVREALTNAIVHGALRIPTREDGLTGLTAHLDAVETTEVPSGSIEVVVSAERGSIAIGDPGAGFDWRRVPARRGHGLAVLHAVFAHVSWNARGNEVRLLVGRRRGEGER
jgi:anti-sigma regulatory factor (Ser/Thr protein kinase)